MPVRSAVPARRVRRFRLRNGLTVLLERIPGSPTASVWVWYRVGSKNERIGITGASHWVEHMLFQGSPRYAKGAIDRAVVRAGGNLNAFTDSDFTAYFTTVPKEHLDLPLDIEADRMTRAIIADGEVERERSVVRSEREGNENWPEFKVGEALGELAYRVHPYRWDPLGYPQDIEQLTPARLRDYYRRFYGPRNAVLVVTGEFDLGEVESTVRSRFGALPPTGDDPTVVIREPELGGERRATLQGPGTTPYLEIAYRAPGIHDGQEIAPAAVLDVIIGGETRLFSVGRGWGAPPEHPSSRLYRALVERGLAVRATTRYRPADGPSLFELFAQAAEGVRVARIESAIAHELRRLASSGPSSSEIEEAREKIRRGAEQAYEGATATGFRRGYFEMLGPQGFEARLLDRLLRVTPQAAQRAARSIFQPNRRVVVTYLPTGGPP